MIEKDKKEEETVVVTSCAKLHNQFDSHLLEILLESNTWLMCGALETVNMHSLLT